MACGGIPVAQKQFRVIKPVTRSLFTRSEQDVNQSLNKKNVQSIEEPELQLSDNSSFLGTSGNIQLHPCLEGILDAVQPPGQQGVDLARWRLGGMWL